MKKIIVLSTLFVCNIFSAEVESGPPDPANQALVGKSELMFHTNQPLNIVVSYNSVHNATAEDTKQYTPHFLDPSYTEHLHFKTGRNTTFITHIFCQPKKPYHDKHEAVITFNPPVELKEKTKTALIFNALLCINEVDWVTAPDDSLSIGTIESSFNVTCDVRQITVE